MSEKWYNKYTMPNQTPEWNISYPLVSDNVNVHGDIYELAADVENALNSLDVSQIQLQVVNNSGENIPAATPVYITGYTTKTNIAKALPANIPILGLTKTAINNSAEGVVVVAGVLENVNTSSFSAGDVLYVAAGGGLTNVPAGGAVGIVGYAATAGIIIVEAKGNGTWGSLKSGLA